ncbi:MAG TPA: methylenetetrahydrofolate reductase [NAD(P)H] [Lachnospiraceae bacterium]|uniref:methylenetetrahydrofolate reductase [NAD(P)H] n=1 Tax=Anaerosporobacter sp. TaxID=1872529 RepID=UPI000EE8BD95|nr:methylenetetrahydrofolate reductase [NAD(P)H] [Anaerosporobacter sp.]HAB61945.1 methylenetetrahydrofolate reductase [NAD(P)H] [Lachnospiraceae bacterium]
MKIKDILNKKQPTLSFEVFPPKKDSDYMKVEEATIKIAKLKPAFMSVTYGAGGGTSKHTVDIAAKLYNGCGVTPLAHLTCASSTKEEVGSQLGRLKEQGIENILALRGDRVAGRESAGEEEYQYASELVRAIKNYGDFCIGAACYPEGHVETANRKEDIVHLKEKVDAGCDFLTTQMFFDNNILYNYLYQLREAGIHVPVIAGIMPVTNPGQIKRICELSGTVLPQRFKAIVEKFGDNKEAMEQAGIAYATDQIIDLYANGVNAVHVYSMNKPEVASSIYHNISKIIG